jgi:glycosyltransferase involved in cell wall biosynthesis
MKRLVIVTELFYPSVGGQEVRYLEWSKVFIEQNWDVTVLTIDHLGTLPKFEKVRGVNVHRLLANNNYIKKESFFPRDIITIGKFTWSVNSFLKQNNADVVIFNQWPIFPQIMISKKKFIGIHDWCELRSGRVWNIIQKLMVITSTVHLTVGTGLKSKLEEKYRLKKEKVKVIPSGIFVKNYNSNAFEKKGVLFFGRLSEHKHPEDAIEAFIDFNKKWNNSETMYVAGGGPLFDKLKEKYSGIETIKILGRISDEKKMELLSSVKIHILPSEREGFPRTVAECMASAIPTITTIYPDNGTCDVVKEYNSGVVVEPDIKLISEALLRFYLDKDYYTNIVKSCIENCACLDWEKQYFDFVDFIGGKL